MIIEFYKNISMNEKRNVARALSNTPGENREKTLVFPHNPLAQKRNMPPFTSQEFSCEISMISGETS